MYLKKYHIVVTVPNFKGADGKYVLTLTPTTYKFDRH